MHISTNDLHCCKPAHLLQQAPSGCCFCKNKYKSSSAWAPSGGRPHRRPPATTLLRSDPPHQQRETAMEDQCQAASKLPPHNCAVAKTTLRIHTSPGSAQPPTPRPSPQRPPRPSQNQGQVPITEQNFCSGVFHCNVGSGSP